MTRLALIFAIVFLMVMQAHADPRWGRGGHGGGSGWHGGGYHHDNGGPLGGVLGGILGGYLWRQFNEPAVIVQEPMPDAAWCQSRYRSYDPYTRTYLGFDGLRHGCP